MVATVLRTHSPYTFYWPVTGPEEYEHCLELAVGEPPSGRTQRLFIAYGYRQAFGQNRRRVLVFRNQGNVLAEFVGTERWQPSREVATYLRREGSRAYLRPGEPVPVEYHPFQLAPARDVLTGSRVIDGVMAVADESDLSTLIGIALAREQASRRHRELKSPGGTTQPPQSAAPGAADAAVIVQALFSLSPQYERRSFTHHPRANRFLCREPFAFLVAACLDRGSRVEAVWKIPYELHCRLGHLEPSRVAAMSEDELERVLRGLPRMPRFPRQSARTIISASQLVQRRCAGHAERLWRDVPAPHVLDTLQRIWGVGLGIAHMTVLLLIAEGMYQPSPGELRHIDVKPDVHVRRVFYRTGLAAAHSEVACRVAARLWWPEFPGSVDWPAWYVGRKWCHKTHPDCPNCPLFQRCPRIGL